MAIIVPTIEETRARIVSDLIQAINIGQSDITKQVDPNIRNSFITGLVNAQAGGFDENNKVLNQLLAQLFLQTATGTFLERLAATYGINRAAATQASGFITFEGTATTSIPSGALLQRVDGVQYTTQALGTISAQTIAITSLVRSGSLVTATTSSDHNLASNITLTSITGATETDYNVTSPIITVTAANKFTYTIATTPTSPATGSPVANFSTASVEIKSLTFGSTSNADNGTPLSLITPIAGVANSSYVQFTKLVGGVDQETDDGLRARALERTANMSAPFSTAGLPIFIKEKVAGVTRVFLQSSTPSPGDITIYFTRDNDTNIIPTAAQALQVKNAIIDPITGIKPANTADSNIIVSPPTAVPATFTFTALSPNTATMQAAINNSLSDFFRNETTVAQDVTTAQYNNIIFSTVDETGATPSSFTLSSPSGNITVAAGQIATLSTPITYP